MILSYTKERILSTQASQSHAVSAAHHAFCSILWFARMPLLRSFPSSSLLPCRRPRSTRTSHTSTWMWRRWCSCSSPSSALQSVRPLASCDVCDQLLQRFCCPYACILQHATRSGGSMNARAIPNQAFRVPLCSWGCECDRARLHRGASAGHLQRCRGARADSSTHTVPTAGAHDVAQHQRFRLAPLETLPCRVSER